MLSNTLPGWKEVDAVACPPKPVKIEPIPRNFDLDGEFPMLARVGIGCCALLLTGAGVWSLVGQEAQTKLSDEEFFAKQVRPVFEANCFQCHSHAGKKAKGGLVVDARASLGKGGDSGRACVPGHSVESVRMQAIRHEVDELRMPDKAHLSDATIAVMREWIHRGARWAAGKEQAARTPGTISAEDRAWWAFQPVRAPALPGIKDSEWNQNNIDPFIKDRLDREGLQPSPVAAPRVLMRRLYFDLTGLPPTPQEADDFVTAWEAPGAQRQAVYEALVDR